ncbi:MAG: hypothetical protein NT121_03785 [Chloroflexi bacterium]|nr:hypothetical protein [Chloroflexota bacterium]
MATDDTQTLVPAAEPEVVDYKKQYEAALRAGERVTHAHEATLAQLNAEKQAHESSKAAIDGLKAEIKDLTATLGQKDGTLETLQGRIVELEPIRVKAMRLQVIMTEFPQLASFEKDGLLPGGETPEALRESLGKFSERLSALSKANEASFASGGKPENVPAPEQKKSSTERAKDYLDAAVQAQRSGNMPEYEANFTKFLHEKNKQQE